MQSAYIELGPNDRAGDEVILVGEGLSESDIATDWEMGEFQTLLHLARCGQRTYAD
jgi:alanine racemase